MNLGRVGGLILAVFSLVLWMACGQVYRPVVIPTTTKPPNPAVDDRLATSVGPRLTCGPAALAVTPQRTAVLRSWLRLRLAS